MLPLDPDVYRTVISNGRLTDASIAVSATVVI
jgi:hypothetical protein